VNRSLICSPSPFETDLQPGPSFFPESAYYPRIELFRLV